MQPLLAKKKAAEKMPEVEDFIPAGLLADVTDHIGGMAPARRVAATESSRDLKSWRWRDVGRLSRRLSILIGADFDALAVLWASLDAGGCGCFAEAVANLTHCASARRHAARLGGHVLVEPHAHRMTLVRHADPAAERFPLLLAAADLDAKLAHLCDGTPDPFVRRELLNMPAIWRVRSD